MWSVWAWFYAPAMLALRQAWLFGATFDRPPLRPQQPGVAAWKIVRRPGSNVVVVQRVGMRAVPRAGNRVPRGSRTGKIIAFDRAARRR